MLTLDPFQHLAVAALDRGESVLVAAPTGAGKTLIADHAVDRALAADGKAFYTTPLKALSNQKFRDLSARLGPERVGLLTGDRSVRPRAPVVVMTTEVLRALLYERSSILDGLSAIVLDEFHYLQDPDRGPVWEEVVVHAPRTAALVCLSATLPDLGVLHRWLEATHGPTALVVEQDRPVALQFLYAVGNLQGAPPLVLPMFVDDGLNATAELRDGVRRTERGEGRRLRDRRRPVTPSRAHLLEHLRGNSMLPAIWFVLSRAGCDRAVADCLEAGLRLTSAAETATIAALVARATGGLDAADARTLDASGWRVALSCGIAAHHGGLAPVQREVIEQAAAQGLVKVVFATETLALGVNLPARTVVIDRVTRSAGDAGGDTITAAEFAQLAGRAGRRGLDSSGNVIVPWAPEVAFHRVAGLAGGRAESLRSHFRATPAMVANLLHAYPPAEARDRFRRSLSHDLLESSLTELRTTLTDRRRERRDVEGENDGSDAGPSGTGPAGTGPAARPGSPMVAERVASLTVGDVIVDPGRPSVGRLAVAAPPRLRRGLPTVDTVRGDGRRVVVQSSDFRLAPAVVGRLDLDDLQPGSRGHARAVADLLVALPPTPAPLAGRPPPSRSARSAASLLQRRARLEAEIAMIESRLAGEESAHEEEFDAVVELLRRRGHLEGWRLTATGLVVRRLFHQRGLLVAECLAAGLFEGLDVPDLASLVSAFRAGTRTDVAASPIPTAELRRRWLGVESLTLRLQRDEAEAGLTPSPAPDPGLLAPIHRWAAGKTLAASLAGTALGPGDLAREARQVVELLEQVAAVALPAVAAAAEQAVRALARGVVTASAHQDAEEEGT